MVDPALLELEDKSTQSASKRLEAIGMSASEERKFLDDSLEQYHQDMLRDKIDRDEAMDDHKFVFSSDITVRNENGAGSQWATAVFRARRKAKRPILQTNRMLSYQQHVDNTGRQNDFKIQVSQGDKGIPETADFFRDAIRQVEYESNASTVYDITRSNQLSSGRAALEVITEYIPGTFQQRVRIKAIPDQFSVLFGPGQEYDRSDSERVWKIKYITKAQHKRKYPKSNLRDVQAFADDQQYLSDWVDVGTNGEMMQIAYKYQREASKVTIYQLADGVSGISEEDPTFAQVAATPGALARDDKGQPITREEDSFKVFVYTMDGGTVFGKEEFIVDDIGIVPLWGLCAVLDGIQRQYSLGNRAKDDQRMLNLCKSNIAQLTGAQTKAKFMADVNAIAKEHQADWSGQTNAALLLHTTWDEDGKLLPVPVPVLTEPPIQAVTEVMNQSIDGMKAAHGIFDAQLGAKSNETSKVAIDARAEQGEIVNFHFVGNEAWTRKRLAQILIKVIAKITPKGSKRTLRSEEGKTRMEPVGTPFDHSSGKQITHVLNAPDYGLSVDMGPSYKSQMDQVHQTDADLIKSLPPAMGMALVPEFLRTQDAPGKERRVQIAENVVNAQMPGVLPPDPEKPENDPAQMALQLQQTQQELQKTQQFAQSLHEQIATKKPELDAKAAQQAAELKFKYEELAVKERLELAKLNQAADVKVLEGNLDRIDKQVGLSHEATQAEADRGQAAQQANADRQYASTEAEAGRQHESEQSQAAMAHEAVQSDVARQHEAEQAALQQENASEK